MPLGSRLNPMSTPAVVLAARPSGPLWKKPRVRDRAGLFLLGIGSDVTVVSDAPYVVDDLLLTSQGVSAGIDSALWLVGRLHGREHARAVRREVQYDPAPPYLADEPLAR